LGEDIGKGGEIDDCGDRERELHGVFQVMMSLDVDNNNNEREMRMHN